MATLLASRPRLRTRRDLRTADDDQLAAQIRAGSQNAFEAVYDRHAAGILAFCRHMLGSREEAEDAVQHTFAGAYRALLADDQREIVLRPWLYAIARNRCLSVLRWRREHLALDDADGRLPATAGLAAAVEQREDLRALLGDLQRLPEDQRAALILAELGAHSHEEIALVLDVPAVKIKALIFQARESLMSRRLARDADCTPIREQLAVLRGGARRRRELRDHLAQCDGCRDFESEIRRQRAGMAVLLPVAPTLALKENVLTGAFTAGGGGVAGGGAAGGAAVGAGAGGSATGVSATVATGAGGAAAGGGAAAAGGGAAAAGGLVAAGGTAVAGGAVAGGLAAVGGSAVLLATVAGAKAVTALVVAAIASGGSTVSPSAVSAQSAARAPVAQAHDSLAPVIAAPATPKAAHGCAVAGGGGEACTATAAAADPASAGPAAAAATAAACSDPAAPRAAACQPASGGLPSADRRPLNTGRNDSVKAEGKCSNGASATASGCQAGTSSSSQPAAATEPEPSPEPARERAAGTGTCTNLPASTASGCQQPTAADPPPSSGITPGDVDADGTPGQAPACTQNPAAAAAACVENPAFGGRAPTGG